VLLAYFGYGDLIGDGIQRPVRIHHNQRKITAEEAWPQVSGPAVADARERKGDGGIFYISAARPVNGQTLSPDGIFAANSKSSIHSCP
jgi:hypothetical protein